MPTIQQLDLYGLQNITPGAVQGPGGGYPTPSGPGPQGPVGTPAPSATAATSTLAPVMWWVVGVGLLMAIRFAYEKGAVLD